MSKLVYLTLAYSAVWAVLATYIFVLVGRNRRLNQEVDELATRVNALEQNGK